MTRRRRRSVSLLQCAFDFAADELDVDASPAPHAERRLTLTVRGMTLPVVQWAAHLGLSSQTIYARMDHGWTAEACVARFIPAPGARKSTEPAGHPHALSWDVLEWSEDDRAWYAVAMHPDGLELQHVADLTGISTTQTNKLIQGAREKCEIVIMLGELLSRDDLDTVAAHLRGHPVEDYRAAAKRDGPTLRAWAERLREGG